MSEPTTFELERMALGEIPTPEEYADAVAELRSSDEEILRRYPSDDLVPTIRRAVRTDVSDTPVAPRWVGPAVVAAAAAIAIAVGVWRSEQRAPKRVLVPGTSGEVRVKGPEVRLQLWRSTDGEPELLRDGARVKAGDVVQAKFGVTRTAHGVLVAIDDAGEATVLFPTEGRDTRIEAGGLRPSPFAFELDETPGTETFHFVACERPVETETVIRWLRSGTPVGSKDCTAKAMEVEKW